MDRISMYRVVNRRIYETGSAELVATVARSGGDWTYEFTQLFRTKRGRFFLAGEGGASSRWRQNARVGDGWVEGDGILPLSDEDALVLVERHAWHRVEEFFACEEA